MKVTSLIPTGRDIGAASHPFLSLQREVDRLFEDFGRGFPSMQAFAGGNGGKLMPSTDVTETDKEIEITAELPGLEEKDVQINLSDNLLTIRGEKKQQAEVKGERVHRYERSFGAFERTFALPSTVDPERIAADYDNGILTVSIPKAERARPREIPVRVA